METDKKQYLVKIQYSIENLEEKRRRNILCRRKKSIIVSDPNLLEVTLHHLEKGSFQEESNFGYIKRLIRRVKSFCRNCNQTYYTVLKT